MIEVGDIVFQKTSGGMIRKVDYSRIGLVLERYQPLGSLPQFRVSFTGGSPAWWESRHLHKIEEEKNDA